MEDQLSEANTEIETLKKRVFQQNENFMELYHYHQEFQQIQNDTGHTMELEGYK